MVLYAKLFILIGINNKNDVTMRFYPIALMFLSLTIFLAIVSPAYAQKITPNHVYQILQNTEYELDTLLESEFVPVQKYKTMGFPNKKPKHVLYRVRQVIIKASELRALYGLPKVSAPPPEVKKITPGDVSQYANKLYIALKEIRTFKGLSAPKKAPLPSGKTPSDVFNHLDVLLGKVIALDAPFIVPNDVFLQALAVYDDVLLIRKHEGLSTNIAEKKFTNKKPGDVYQKAVELIVRIAEVLGNQTEGIYKKYALKGKITPAHVQAILGVAAAELMDIKIKKGITQSTSTHEKAVGKTPSDVFAYVDRSVRALEGLK